MSHLNVCRKIVPVVLFLLFSSALPTFAVANEIYGVVNTETSPLSIRSQPNEQGALITTVKKGAKLQILGNAGQNNWYKVQLSNGTVGYASSEYIVVLISQGSQKSILSKPSEPTSAAVSETYGMVNTKTDPLNIRRQPSLKSAPITTVNKGAKLRILGDASQNGWYKVQLSNGTVGYASSEYIVLVSQDSQKNILSVPSDSLTKNRCWADFSDWGNFKRYSYEKRISTPNGFLILSSPTRDAADIVTPKAEASASVIGHLEIDGDKFYLTAYSCDQYKNGGSPNWIYVK